MRLQRSPFSLCLLATFFLLIVVLLSGCDTDTPQNTLAPEGDVADKQRDLFNLVLWPAIVVMVIVEAALVLAVWRFRRRSDNDLPKQVHGNIRLEIAWTVAPAILLLVLAVPTIAAIIDLDEDPGPDALNVNVIARQWSWEFQYPDFLGPDGQPVSSLNELHIPVERDILAAMTSEDIIHSFWVPRLAGKIDVVPTHTNELAFNANSEGEYSGQCAEFCGRGHALMRMTIIAESESEFLAWIKEQQAAASPTTTVSPTPGSQ